MIVPDVKRMRICNSIYIDSFLDNSGRSIRSQPPLRPELG